MHRLRQFTLADVGVLTAVVAALLAGPIVSFLILVVTLIFLSVCTFLGLIAVVVRDARLIPNRMLRPAVSMSKILAALTLTCWIASEQFSIKHNHPEIATLEVEQYGVGLTCGIYLAPIRPGWNVSRHIPYPGETYPGHYPRLRLPMNEPYRQHFEMWLPFWLILAIPITLLGIACAVPNRTVDRDRTMG